MKTIIEEVKNTWQSENYSEYENQEGIEETSKHNVILTSDHELLTNKGWKTIKDITLNHKVATLNKDKIVLEWDNPSEIKSFFYEGEMVQISNQHVDFTVSKDSKIYSCVKDKFNLYKVSEIENDFNLLKDCVSLNEQKNRYITEMNRIWWFDELYILIAIYVCYKNKDDTLIIKDKKKITSVINFFNKYDIKYKNVSSEIILTDKVFVDYLKNYGFNEENPLPEWIFEMNHSDIRKFVFDIFKHLGDEKNIIVTDNKYLVSCIQRFSLSIRKYIHVSKDDNRYICEYKDFSEYFLPKAKKEIVNIKDKVYSISVQDKVFLIRRNMKYCWI